MACLVAGGALVGSGPGAREAAIVAVLALAYVGVVLALGARARRVGKRAEGSRVAREALVVVGS